MKYNRLLPLLIPFLIWLLDELFFFKPKMIYTALVLSLCLILFAIRQFARAGLATNEWWKFIIFPAMFLLSVAAYTTIIFSKTVIQLLFLLNAVFLFFYLRSVYYGFFEPIVKSGFTPHPKYPDHRAGDELYINTERKFQTPQASARGAGFTTSEISSYGNFLIYFFIGASLYGWLSFLNSPLWPLMLVVILVSIIVIYEVLWENKINPAPTSLRSRHLVFTPSETPTLHKGVLGHSGGGVNFREALIFIIIGSLILLEMAWSISFLPLNFNIIGLILAICYYMTVGFIKYYLFDNLNKKIVKSYLLIGFGSIFILFLTARWF
jgi:hypothetical protein